MTIQDNSLIVCPRCRECGCGVEVDAEPQTVTNAYKMECSCGYYHFIDKEPKHRLRPDDKMQTMKKIKDLLLEVRELINSLASGVVTHIEEDDGDGQEIELVTAQGTKATIGKDFTKGKAVMEDDIVADGDIEGQERVMPAKSFTKDEGFYGHGRHDLVLE